MFEKKIQESLGNFEPKFNEEAWNKIENQVLKNNHKFHSQKSRLQNILWGLGGLSVAVLAFVFVSQNKNIDAPIKVSQTPITQPILAKTESETTVKENPNEVKVVISPKEAAPAKQMMPEAPKEAVRTIAPLLIAERNAICLGEKAKIVVGSTANTYIKYGNIEVPADKNMTLAFDQPGDYKVTLLKLENGSKSEKHSVRIKVSGLPNKQFIIKKSNDPKNPEVTFSSTEGTVKANWYIDNDFVGSSSQMSYLFNTRGQYSVKLVSESEEGCKDSSFQSIRILQGYNLMASSVFNPDKEAWLPLGLKKSGTKFSLRILDTNGNEVFSTSDPNEAWDGTIDGEKAPNGEMYIWLAKVYDKKNRVREYGDSFLITSMLD